MIDSIKTAWAWMGALTEGPRSWLSWKIFPEQFLYMEAVKRIAELEENDRIVKLLHDSDSACSEWAIDTVRVKLSPLEDMLKELEEKYGEAPF